MQGQLVACLILIIGVSEGLKCPGSCMSKEDCKAKKGKIRGYCSNEKPCCDLEASHTGSCNGKIKGLKSAIFQSPLYPSFLARDLVCSFDFELDESYQAILVEFIDVIMDGLGYTPHSQCEGGMLILSGFGIWRPVPLCGMLSGYAVLIEKSKETEFLKTLRIHGVMSGEIYRWKIKITQITKTESTPTPDSSLEDNNQLSWNIVQSEHTSESDQINKNAIKLETQIASPSPDTENTVVFIDDDEDRRSGQIISTQPPLIQNGEDTNITVVPWQASLRHFYPNKTIVVNLNMSDTKKQDLLDSLNREGKNCSDLGKHFCGGSIISDRHILTAAHCVDQQSKAAKRMRLDEIRIYLGDTNLCLDDGVSFGQPSQYYSVDQIIFHYNYDSNHLINDIAVIRLKEKIKFLDYIKPISLPQKAPKDKVPSFEGKPVRFSGWGLTNLTHRQNLPLVLQYTEDITVQSRSFCEKMLRQYFRGMVTKPKGKFMWIFNSVICTNATVGAIKAANLGQGDSGGPLYLQENPEDDPMQIGIASFMVRHSQMELMLQEQSLADAFTSVAFYRSWIDFAIGV